MKRFFCLAVSCVLAASALAQVSVTTPIMGFLTLNLQPGTNFMGFALLPSMDLQGVVNIDSINRKRLFLQGSPQLSLSDGQFSSGSHATHTVEIVSGSGAVGFSSVVTSTLATGNEIVLADAVPEGVDNGASIKIWKLWTLGGVFGSQNTTGLTGGSSPDVADIVQIPNEAGFAQYFYSTGGGDYSVGWRLVGDFTTDQAAVPLQFSRGVAIQARSAKSVIIVGQVKPGNTLVTLQPGNNFVANLCPVQAGESAVGRTLGNSGLQAGLTSGPTFPLSDLVLLWNGSGYDQYFYCTGGLGGSGWRRIGAGNGDQQNVPLPDGAYIIHRRASTTAQVQINQGEF